MQVERGVVSKLDKMYKVYPSVFKDILKSGVASIRMKWLGLSDSCPDVRCKEVFEERQQPERTMETRVGRRISVFLHDGQVMRNCEQYSSD